MKQFLFLKTDGRQSYFTHTHNAFIVNIFQHNCVIKITLQIKHKCMDKVNIYLKLTGIFHNTTLHTKNSCNKKYALKKLLNLKNCQLRISVHLHSLRVKVGYIVFILSKITQITKSHFQYASYNNVIIIVTVSKIFHLFLYNSCRMRMVM